MIKKNDIIEARFTDCLNGLTCGELYCVRAVSLFGTYVTIRNNYQKVVSLPARLFIQAPLYKVRSLATLFEYRITHGETYNVYKVSRDGRQLYIRNDAGIYVWVKHVVFEYKKGGIL